MHFNSKEKNVWNMTHLLFPYFNSHKTHFACLTWQSWSGTARPYTCASWSKRLALILIWGIVCLCWKVGDLLDNVICLCANYGFIQSTGGGNWYRTQEWDPTFCRRIPNALPSSTILGDLNVDCNCPLGCNLCLQYEEDFWRKTSA